MVQVMAAVIQVVSLLVIFGVWWRYRDRLRPAEIDAEDLEMLKERDAQGNLTHKLCIFCAGWHVPQVTAVGCPRIKAAQLDKHQSVLNVEYWADWDKTHTIFPWQLPEAPE